ncbi:MAG TPA: hypothetical protein VIP58_03995, partial [Nocardioides sp.]
MSASNTDSPPAAAHLPREGGGRPRRPIGRSSGSRPRTSRWVEASMVLPALVVFVGLLVVPVGYAVYYSFTDYNGFPTQTPEIVGLDNYVRLF